MAGRRAIRLAPATHPAGCAGIRMVPADPARRAAKGYVRVERPDPPTHAGGVPVLGWWSAAIATASFGADALWVPWHLAPRSSWRTRGACGRVRGGAAGASAAGTPGPSRNRAGRRRARPGRQAAPPQPSTHGAPGGVARAVGAPLRTPVVLKATSPADPAASASRRTSTALGPVPGTTRPTPPRRATANRPNVWRSGCASVRVGRRR